MKVTLINHSDCRGGASVVSMRLVRALRDAGVDARMIVARAEGAVRPAFVARAASAAATTAAFLAEEGMTWLDNGLSMKNLFALDAARAGLPLERHPWVRDADVVCLNWVNQGMLSLRGVERIAALGKPLVWTMHDMWNATGLCHHAGECTRYMEQCGHCPLMQCPSHGNDLSHRRHLRKMQCYDRSGITFVAVSSWLAERCRESSLMRGRRVEVIPNAFPVDEFSLEPAHTRAELGLPDDGRHIIVMGAARLDDPVKGLPLAVETLNRLAAAGYGERVLAVFFGALRDGHALSGLRMPHVHLGTVGDAARLRSLYAHARVVLSTSHYETLPGTLIEGQAAGAYPASFGRGGQRDIIDAPRTGYIARYPDTADLAAGIAAAIEREPDREALRASVTARFAAPAVAARYIELFEGLMQVF
ncbi:MAG: glycosyltransferase [Muribaculaceae bacterium]|nr:glycosyltransferase [Muribaculaceae bacterium]